MHFSGFRLMPDERCVTRREAWAYTLHDLFARRRSVVTQLINLEQQKDSIDAEIEMLQAAFERIGGVPDPGPDQP